MSTIICRHSVFAATSAVVCPGAVSARHLGIHHSVSGKQLIDKASRVSQHRSQRNYAASVPPRIKSSKARKLLKWLPLPLLGILGYGLLQGTLDDHDFEPRGAIDPSKKTIVVLGAYD